MTSQEYRDLVDDVADTLTSAKSAATESELDKEVHQLLVKLGELDVNLHCPKAKGKDKDRALRVQDSARQFCCNALMFLNDNQRLEGDYFGRKKPMDAIDRQTIGMKTRR